MTLLKNSIDDLRSSVARVKSNAEGTVTDHQAITALRREMVLAKADPLIDLRGQDLSAMFKDLGYYAAGQYIYDTTQDSDGGAWRYNRKASWYNEPLGTATRGLRREFPALALIVVKSDFVTIYDADRPDLPMWMMIGGGDYDKFTYHQGGNKLTSACMLNGMLCIGHRNATNTAIYWDGGLKIVDFAKDHLKSYSSTKSMDYTPSHVAARFSVAGEATLDRSIIDARVDDVDMMILRDAPCDPATGLPIPTIALATESGLSFIHHDGTVTSRAEAVENMDTFEVKFLSDDGTYMYNHHWAKGHDARTVIVPGEYLKSEAVIGYNTDQYQPWEQMIIGRAKGANYANTPYALYMDSNHYDPNGSAKVITPGAMGGDRGITHFFRDPSTPTRSMVAYSGRDYATGWMVGRMHGAWLSETDTSDASQSLFTVATPTTKTLGTGIQINQTIAGEFYQVEYTVDSSDFTGHFFTSDTLGARKYALFDHTPGDHTIVVEATGTNFTLSLGGGQGHTGSITFSMVRARRTVPDRNYNPKPLAIHGTMTREPVAEGAELVAYKGMNKNGSNYLRTALDAPLGDGFSLTYWCKGNTGDNGVIYLGPENLSTSNHSDGWYVWVHGERVKSHLAGNVIHSDPGVLPSNGTWWQGTHVQKDGVHSQYINGKLVRTDTVDVSGVTQRTLTIGAGFYNGWAENHPGLALLRLSRVAPSPAQIVHMYDTERHLFKPGAAGTMIGAGTQVRSIARDPVTELLHVGTTAGFCTFRGLERISAEAKAGGITQLAAYDGLIAKG